MRVYTTLLLLVLAGLLCAQHAELQNMNPDPNGEPWYVGQLRPLTAADSLWLASLPRLQMQQGYRPPQRTELDNTQHPWFRPIFNQDGGSCGQASGVGYNYTYEIDYLRGLAATSTTTQYPTHYTWDFLNGGDGGGSWYWDGWNIIDANGVCNVAEYGGHYAYGGESRWMSGYDEYYAGMDNRMGQMMAIEVSTEQGLETLKGWMNDYLDGEETGGLANFASGVSPYESDMLLFDSAHPGEEVVTAWNPSVNHAMTFGGYCDSVCVDRDGDGIYRNDIDINNDGVVDMRDWERGALMVVNSWGLSFGNAGKIWMPYHLLAETLEDGGIWMNTVHVMRARDGYEPLLTARATVTHERRKAIKLVAGVNPDTSATEPAYTLEFPLFHNQGGALYMQGGDTTADKTLELGLDFTPLLGHIEPGQPARWFLELHESDPWGQAWGQLNAFSVYDHTGDEPVQWTSAQSDLELENDGVTRIWADAIIDYQPVAIQTTSLPLATANEPYSQTLQAQYGEAPYTWNLVRGYSEVEQDWAEPMQVGDQLVVSNLDDGYGKVYLPFSFPFFTGSYDSLLVGTDGTIVLDADIISVRSLENLMKTPAIVPYGTDLQLYEEYNDGIWVDTEIDQVHIHWSVSRFDQPFFNASFTVTLHSDGRIEFSYGNDITSSDNWVAGVSEGDGRNFYVASFSGSETLPSNTATAFEPEPMPLGMSLSEDGLLAGTPTQVDSTWQLTVRVTDSYRVSDEQVLTFTTSANGVNDSPAYAAQLHAWPNPFNPEVSLSFALAQPQRVKLEVFNVRGRKVCTLADECLEAGQHTLVWHGRDDAGRALATGVYFCRLTAGESHDTTRLLLLK